MLKTIPTSELKLGMYVHDLGGPWLDHPFWRTRFKLTDAQDLHKMRECGVAQVTIDVSKGLDVAQAHPDAASSPAPAADSSSAPEEDSASAPAGRATRATRATAASAAVALEERPPDARDLKDELVEARRLIGEARQQVTVLFNDVRMGRIPDTEQVFPLVQEIADSVDRNREALISLARLKNRDDYTYMHSVAVCGLMIALAREMGLEKEQILRAGLAGLVHDIGKVFVPPAILNKPGRLSDGEWVVMREHPRAGWELLSQAPGICEEALDVCLHHHEKWGGQGYPEGLQGAQISLYARMGAVCDVYDAVTSERAYNRGWNPAETLGRMASWQGHFEPGVFQSFVRALGIYPVGSLVRLESGRLGVVIEQSRTSLLSPRVLVFFSAKTKEPIAVRILQPGAHGCGDRIVAREDPRAWGFERLDDLWQGAA